MSTFNFLSSIWRSLRRRWKKSQTIPTDRTCVVLPPSVSIPPSAERASYYRIISPARRQGKTAALAIMDEKTKRQRDLVDAAASRARMTSAPTETTPAPATVVRMTHPIDADGTRHYCQDETATVVSGRWYCNCPGGAYFTDPDLARAYRTHRDAGNG